MRMMMIPLLALFLLGHRSCDAFALQSFSSSNHIERLTRETSQHLATSPHCFRLHATLEKSGSASSSSPLKEEQEGATKTRLPGTAVLGLPWEELGFEFRPTRSHLKMVHRDGAWQKPELVEGEPYMKVHIGATALHYGQSCFEGLKAFCHADNSVHLFCPSENAARMQTSCRRTLMAELPTDKFVEACKMVVRDNIEYVPPYGSNGALYIRPLLFGSGPRIGLQPADEYTFLCMVIPVGDYYKGGLSNPVKGRIITDYDRAAPRGVGNVKVAGNYAADILPNTISKKAGFPIGLYLDAATQTKIEEFSTSNFVGIRYGRAQGEKDTYLSPNSPSVLPSITNKALMQVAKDQGLNVEQRDVLLEELDDMDEVFAVGTAVVLTPVGSLTLEEGAGGGTPKVWTFGENPDEIGPVTRKLYDQVRAIQNGEQPDLHGWNVQV